MRTAPAFLLVLLGMEQRPGCISRIFGCGCSLVMSIVLMIVGIGFSLSSLYRDRGFSKPPKTDHPVTDQPAHPPDRKRRKPRKKK